MGKSHFFTIIAIISLSILGILFSIIDPLVMRMLIDDVLIGKNPSLLIPALIILFCIYLVSALSDYYSARIKGTLDILLFTELSSRIFDKVQKTEYKDLQQLKIGDLQSRTMSNIGSIIQTITGTIPQVLVTGLRIFIPVIIMYSLDAEITMIVILPAFLFVLSSWYFGEQIKTRQKPALDSSASLQSFLKEAYSTIPLIKVFGLENWALKKYNQHLSQYTGFSVDVVKVGALNSAVTMLIYGIPTILVIILGSMAVLKGTMTLGTLTAFIGYAGMFFSPIQMLSLYWNNYKSSQASYERVSALLDLKPDISSGERPLSITKGEIEYKNIGFSFGDRTILRDFDATFIRGRNYLIGDNGSGKTTIAKLLCGLYTPDHGKILIDGQDISDVSRYSLRSSVSVVFSDSLLFDGTIADNILFGDLSATKEEMVMAAKKAELHDFVMRLPAQYNTNVGESGLNLSSGEKQKIALARVILRNSPIIIFDEFTRSIDVESKKSIYSVINQLNSKTIIIITHDMSDIELDGRIVVLEREGTTPLQDSLPIPSVTQPQAVPWG